MMLAGARVLRAHGPNGPFDLVLVRHGAVGFEARVYCSLSEAWSQTISVRSERRIVQGFRSVQIGNSVFWLLNFGAVLEYDADKLTLTVIGTPPRAPLGHNRRYQVLGTPDSGLGLAVLDGKSLQLWRRKKKNPRSSDSVWYLARAVLLTELVRPGTWIGRSRPSLVGFEEETNSITFWIAGNIYLLNLDSMLSTPLMDRSLRDPQQIHLFRRTLIEADSDAGEVAAASFHSDGGAQGPTPSDPTANLEGAASTDPLETAPSNQRLETPLTQNNMSYQQAISFQEPGSSELKQDQCNEVGNLGGNDTVMMNFYASELRQLQEMGFFDHRDNIQALISAAGNVNDAIVRLLGTSTSR
ncbi:hypothetical protein ACQJBY_043389 [Aegilops geniculata]